MFRYVLKMYEFDMSICGVASVVQNVPIRLRVRVLTFARLSESENRRERTSASSAYLSDANYPVLPPCRTANRPGRRGETSRPPAPTSVFIGPAALFVLVKAVVDREHSLIAPRTQSAASRRHPLSNHSPVSLRSGIAKSRISTQHYSGEVPSTIKGKPRGE